MQQTESTKTIYSKVDASRLREIADSALFNGFTNKSLIRQLSRSIADGELREPEAMPLDVVTMRSVVSVTDMTEGTQRNISIQYPEDAEPLDGKFSILTPAGLALLGAHVGDIVSFEAPSGTRELRVDKLVYQPEALGHYRR